ncbi:MAG: mercury resistance system transport protein MerF [Rhodospirillaceae bacterium]|jgi:mercuric ion transport protein|nr:mercury resistance system transport protein MerF [Rhodospirillales bacterium]MBT3906750.1 mercury resistance system transport protein MerF [Rhodospirillaceae bacterium]MBT4702489.1 mercury resistance system transport protein MerF [Rhodospirillaceae bacterium]MBT6221262.1 mercury resistance system transport protein MerF [Rhodospirillaceae bacterium]MBT6362839.1 mercury resistance system transport protein MerF [Rhodospirillaceae bacterium]
MNDQKLMRVGVIGTVVAVLCCFTPILVIALSALGLSALTGMLDIVLLPLLGIFIGIMVYATWKRQKSSES